MSTTPPIPGSTPQGFAASARLDNAGRVFRRRDDRDQVSDLQSLLDRVPAVVARVHRSAQGHWSVPFASSDFARLCGIGLPALREDARLLSARIHADDLARLSAAWALHGESLHSLRERLRVRQPGASLYLVTNFQGQSIVGNITALPPEVLLQPGVRETSYERMGEANLDRRALAQGFEGPLPFAVGTAEPIGVGEQPGETSGAWLAQE